MANNAPTYLVFDFFGTLVAYDKSPTVDGYRQTFGHIQAVDPNLTYESFVHLWNETYQQLDQKALEHHREFSMIELSARVLSKTRARHSKTLANKVAAAYLKEWNASVTYIAGLEDLICELSNSYSLAILSNTHDTELVPHHLAAMGIDDCFQKVITSVEFGHRKPNASIFHHTIAALGTNAETCLYIGDSYDADYRGATDAGLEAWLIDPNSAHDIPDTHRINSVLDLKQRL